MKSPQDVAALTALLRTKLASMPKEQVASAMSEVNSRQRYFVIYPDDGPLRRELYYKHLEFFAAGLTFKERLALAANRSGKCSRINTLVDTPDGERYIGDLYRSAAPFKVYAWDGGKRVVANASAPFKKQGLHQCYRITMSDGRWVEVADYHRILTPSGWRFLSELLPIFGLSPLETIADTCRSVPNANAPHLSGTLRDYRDGYSADCRLGDGQLHFATDTGLASTPSQGGALQHNRPWSYSDDRMTTHTDIPSLIERRLSSLCEEGHRAGQFSALSSQIYSTNAGQWIGLDPTHDQFLPVSYACLQCILGPSLSSLNQEISSSAFPFVLSSNNIVRVDAVGVNDVYDFEVEEFHNYTAGGLIHHNTTLGAFELTAHMTGIYRDWWPGKRVEHVGEWLACGTTTETTRDIVQKELLGSIGDEGTGMIPKDMLVDIVPKRGGLPGAVESFKVRHEKGKISMCSLKTYEQGRKAFEGTAKLGAWLDEEAPMDVYSEILLRTMTTRGMLWTTFTPMAGMSDVVRSFLEPTPEAAKHKTYVQFGWAHVPHLDEQEKEILRATIPPHQLRARMNGDPVLGSGAVYQVEEQDITCDPFVIPDFWPRCYALDVGWNMTAALWGAQDPASKKLYLYAEHYVKEQPVAVHAAAIRSRGEWIPGVIDPASLGGGQDDGRKMIQQYRECGLKLTPAVNAVESGIAAVWEMMLCGNLKIFRTLENLLAEIRTYHRSERGDGKIVKKRDHLIDDLRYIVTSGIPLMRTAKLSISKPASRPELAVTPWG